MRKKINPSLVSKESKLDQVNQKLHNLTTRLSGVVFQTRIQTMRDNCSEEQFEQYTAEQLTRIIMHATLMSMAGEMSPADIPEGFLASVALRTTRGKT